METTAEGIEYMDQLYLMRRLKVSHVQGWVYSKALPCDEWRAAADRNVRNPPIRTGQAAK